MMMTPQEALVQITLGLLFYFSVVLIFRLAGKRFAGQTTTFDLVILISLSVAIQHATLREGTLNALIFVVTVFVFHLLLARICQINTTVRQIIRGRPCPLVRNGEVLYSNLRKEGMSLDELNAGIRKMGIAEISRIKEAYLEETGQISVIKG